MSKINKICSFYVSDWHMITMLLPHINKMINEETKIATILEQDTKNKIELLLSKLKLKNERQIKRINWKNTEKIEEKIEEIINSKSDKIEIIVAGSNEYIEKVNICMEQKIKTKNTEKEIKILNCYNIENVNIKEILNKHDKVLNTSGEKSKEKFMAEIK